MYKRQPIDVTNRPDLSFLIKASETVGRRTVSYTHLDVYKRQGVFLDVWWMFLLTYTGLEEKIWMENGVDRLMRLTDWMGDITITNSRIVADSLTKQGVVPAEKVLSLIHI